MAAHAVAERFDFADTLSATAPDAPTLCTPWTAAHLAAHVVLRERSTVQLTSHAPIEAVRRWSADRLARFADRTAYPRLVELVHDGAPRWSVFAWPPVRERANLLEYVVHHEDVRRAGPTPFPPREIPSDRAAAIWAQLRVAARLTLRQAPVGVVLVGPDGDRIVARSPVDGQSVVVTGDPVELALVAFGRQRVATADYAGDERALATFADAAINV
jgi:uncharacterized protein (TIGR03085 family)